LVGCVGKCVSPDPQVVRQRRLAVVLACEPEKADVSRSTGSNAMRYVIGICIVTGFLIWDFGYNEGRYITYAVMELKRLTAMVGA
jgi:hypothetical protein